MERKLSLKFYFAFGFVLEYQINTKSNIKCLDELIKKCFAQIKRNDKKVFLLATVSFMDLGHCYRAGYFELILTLFEESFSF
jgi:hypothetical protein